MSSGAPRGKHNAALYRLVLCRLRWAPRTRAYMHRRTTEGLSKKDIIRCLKRLVAREIYYVLTARPHHSKHLRPSCLTSIGASPSVAAPC